MSDPQRPSEWRKYLRGICSDCWAGCCTLPVEAGPEDLARLGWMSREEADAEWAWAKAARRLIAEKRIQSYDPRRKLYVLAQVAGRDCVLLDPKTRLCTAYDKRPEVCRGFPHIGPRPGFCPYKKK